MHNLAALARRYEEKWAAERSAAAASSTTSPSPDHRHSHPAAAEDANARNGDSDSASPRNWSVPTNRFNSEVRSRTRTSSGIRRTSEGNARRVLVVPLEEKTEAVARGRSENTATTAGADKSMHSTIHTGPANAPHLRSSVSSFSGYEAPQRPHTHAPAIPQPVSHGPGEDIADRERRETSPVVSLAWVPQAPLPVSPPPLSLATEDDGSAWMEVQVDLSESTTTTMDSPRDAFSSASDVGGDAHVVRSEAQALATSSAPILVDFYVERDDLAESVAADPFVGPLSQLTDSRGGARAQYDAVRRKMETLTVPPPPSHSTTMSAKPPVVADDERDLFRSFLDDVTGARSAETTGSQARHSGLHESALSEVQELQWALVEELCCAVRPFAKVLLLRLMTAAEADHGQHSLRSTSLPATSHLSMVPLTCCVETINALLAQHNVRDVQATRYLCQRVSDYGSDTSAGGADGAKLDSSTTVDGNCLVEYATFVSHVLEIAYAAAASPQSA